MKITIGRSAAGKSVSFDLDILLLTRLLITANSGAGKSYLLRKLIEALFGHVQEIVIDPEGEFSTLREKFGFALVGPGGEIPADVRIAGDVAEKLLELRLSAVCDLYEMKDAQRHEWVQKFLDALVNAPKKLWHPLVVVVDEAQMFCPETKFGQSVATDSMIALTTRGRKRGYCAIWATQRLALLQRTATAMLLNRLVGGTFEDVDVKRSLELLSVAPEDQRAFKEQLRLLEPGNFFAFGRAISKQRLLFHVDTVETTHPQPGSSKHAEEPPPPPEKVKAVLAKLAEIPHQAEEKARTVADFKRQIAELKVRLTTADREAKRLQTSAPARVVEKAVPDERAIARAVAPLRASLEEAMKIIAQITAIGFEGSGLDVDQVKGALESAATQIVKLADQKLSAKAQEIQKIRRQAEGLRYRAQKLLDAATEDVTVEVTVKKQEPIVVTPGAPRTQPLPREREPRPVHTGNGDGPKIGKLHLEIAGILAGYYPQPVKTSILAVMVGRVMGGTFSARLSECRGAGILEDAGAGEVTATADAAVKYAGTFNPPTTTEEVLELWSPKLGGTARKVLELLVQRGGRPVARSEAAEYAGTVEGGTFSARLSELRSTGLMVDVDRGQIAANAEVLFL